MALEGMDITAVQAIAGKLDAQAQQLESLRSQVTATVSSATGVWKGPDVQKFEQDWHSHQVSLKQAEAAIKELSAKAKSNAAQQQATSSSY
jgi:uncharacterized protein YukE